MSNFNLQGGNGDSDQSANLQSLLAQFRRQSGQQSGQEPDTPEPGNHQHQHSHSHQHQGSGSNLLSHFNSYNKGSQSYYDTSNPESPGVTSSVSINNPLLFPPAAPTPPVQGLIHHSQYPPAMMSSNASQGNGNGNDMSANLLSLLKFSGNQQSPRESLNFQPAPAPAPAPALPAQSIIHAPAPTAADPTGLLAALIKGHVPTEPAKPEPPSTWNTGPPPDSTQQYLLNLLNRPKPSQNDTLATATTEPLQANILNQAGEQQNNCASPAGSTAKPPSFGYNNPFDDFSGSSPARRHTPKSSTEPGTITSQTALPQATMPIQILKKPDSAQSNHSNQSTQLKRVLSDRSFSSVTSPENRQKMEHAASPLSHMSQHIVENPDVIVLPVQHRQKESVADAMSELAEKADLEAQEAIARAEEELERSQAEEQQAVDEEIAQDLQNLLNAKTEAEFDEAAQITAAALQRELNKEENQSALESALDADIAQSIKDIIADTAEGNGEAAGVADSWESAEADEIIVVEEMPEPVKVYNFPMKPWITISVQETEEPRAVFHDDAILDIARLKKEFDQIDRNLVGVSEAYLAYGMSKAGGFRVVRQTDGKDARLFTDTKDRIFNVSVSSSATASNHPPKETVICTGVSGTVYWVQLRNGDRDHVEDAHPEQYGFALPPISTQTQDGETPGGVLKTRARASSAHPEYFAVGRGKSIHIIWPSFIFHHSLFKAGHDRVVDTEKLLKQCSLKINTGKAGKDFTFAQDDTVLVSLDKSGRVKFWDVRDLTAIADNSDPSNPLPAQTSLEVKEPLLTLTTTPEGEKAWPTSVLLLDKFRPYQKRTALRYMIVGMKQNHTLQLWDLALGKCVQEFHFPHNKESDAVCSVLYHAPTSMIVVGHPTRNSIYFLHLSAPKYTLKNISQVDYVQRLASQDSSIPQPDSTAVISGIREYSFANKGILRSLTILENPSAHGEADEPILFELYAMHSKGVTCICIKQNELGWTKDNKVLAPVDAEKLGFVKISKLPEVASPPSREPEPEVTPQPQPQIRIATRSARDLLQKTPSSQGEDKKTVPAIEAQTPMKVLERERGQDVDSTPVHAPSEKPERERKRRKKAAANNASAEREREAFANSALNGASELSRTPSLHNKNAHSNQNHQPNSRTSFETAPTQILSAEHSNTMDRAGFAPAHSTIDMKAIVEPVLAKLSTMEGAMVDQLAGPVLSAFDNVSQKFLEIEERRSKEFSVNYAVLLDRVQKALADNTDALLAQLVKDNFDKLVVPYITDQYYKITSSVNSTLTKALRQDVQHALPGAVNQALQHPEVLKPYSDRIAHEVKAHLDAQTLKSTNMAVSNVMPKVFAKFEADFYRKVDDKLSDHQRAQDAKIGQLADQMKDLAMAVTGVASVQTQLQQDMAAIKQLLLQQQRPDMSPASSGAHSHPHRDSRALAAPPSIASQQSERQYQQAQQYQQQQRVQQAQQAQQPQQAHLGQQYQQQQLMQQLYQFQPEPRQPHQLIRQPMSTEDRKRVELDALVAKVFDMMQKGEYKGAVLELMSAAPPANETVYERAVAPFGTSFLAEIGDPLVLLSAAHSVALQLGPGKPLLKEKLALVEDALKLLYGGLGELNADVRQVVPDIFPAIKENLEALFGYISKQAPHDPYLKKITAMNAYATRILETVAVSPASYGPHY